MTDPVVLIPVLMLLSALVGMVSNRLRPHWGLLLLPFYLVAWIVAIVAYTFYFTPDQIGPLTVKGVINDTLFMLFPLFLLNAPPFLVGRYVPQLISFTRRPRSHAQGAKSA